MFLCNREIKKDVLVRVKFEESTYIAKVSAEKYEKVWLLFLLIITFNFIVIDNN